MTALDVLDEAERRLLVSAPPPTAVQPMLATLSAGVVRGPGWVFEPKLDGVRVVGLRNGTDVRLVSRNGKPQNGAYPEIVEALGEQPTDPFVCDGEVVAFEGERTSFARLQGRMQLRDPARAALTGIPVHYFVFDILYLEGRDTTALPLVARKRLLEAAFRFDDRVCLSRHLEASEPGAAERYLAEACRKGWEGLVAKRADAPYIQKRSRDWLKLKCSNRQEFVIGGWTDPEGTRSEFGALLVGYHEGGELVYAGKVGTGFDYATLADIGGQLALRDQEERPFAVATGLPRKGVHWAHPDLVCEVAFSEWTSDGKLRHPRFLGLRHDKPAHAVVRERAATPA